MIGPIEHEGIVYRTLERERGEHNAAVELQGRIWAPDIAIPIHQLIAADSCGALLLGAFHDGALIGFCYGFPAHRDGAVWLHSHQTGVDGAFRDRGIGETLKWLQRHVALRAGYERITWTFDPLQSRNAYVNLTKLGATSDRYIIDYYGELPDAMNEGLPSDRLWMTWSLTSQPVTAHFERFRAVRGIDWPSEAARDRADGSVEAGPMAPGDAPPVFATRAVEAGVRAPSGGVHADLDATQVLIETPVDLDSVREVIGDEAALAWRMLQREAFTAYLEEGYVAVGFDTATDGSDRGWYVLERDREV